MNLVKQRTELQKKVSRREAIKGLAVLTAGLGVGCTPLRIAMHLYPDEFDNQPERVDRVLRAFVATVIPGAPLDDPNLIRAFYDSYYPLAKCRNFFAADLCQRALNRFGTDDFERLAPEQRTGVIESGLSQSGTIGRVYTGAIFLTQIAFYAGIYDADRGCPLIGFDGRYRFRSVAQTSYPNPGSFLARARTADGNPS
jgi:hypothetical protein